MVIETRHDCLKPSLRKNGGRRAARESLDRVVESRRRRNKERSAISHRRNAAVELDLGTGHEPAFVGSKVDDGVRDVVGLAEPSKRHLPSKFLKYGRFIPPRNERVENWGPDKSRMNRIAANVPTVASAVQRDGL